MTAPKGLVGNPSKRECPAAFHNLGRSSITKNRDTPPLIRWKATWDALSSRLTPEDSPSTPQQTLDAVQAEIVAAQIKRASPLPASPKGGPIDLDFPRLTHPIGHQELEVFFQLAHADSDGVEKLYRLKTGQIREDQEFVSHPEEIAVVVSDPRFPESLEAYEIRTADGEMIRMEMSSDRAKQVLAELERDYRQMVDASPHRLREGWHCTRCEVADLCPTFPAIDPSAEPIGPHQRRMPSVRRLMISKSRLPEMDYCQRRAAWRTWFFIPPDSDHYTQGTSPALALGNRFHHQMAQALMSDHPESFFTDDPESLALYQQHRRLPCTPELRITKTEFPLGFTTRLRYNRRLVSMVLYGLADAAGREIDGTPAIIDHKTGRQEAINPYEAPIYALGGLLRLSSESQVAIHIHQLAADSGAPECQRTVWQRDQLRELASPLMEVAQTAALWDLEDAGSIPFQVGDWCATCPFEQRCLSHR